MKKIDRECYSDVELVDLNEFIRGLGHRIKLLKLDVEGVEFELINQLIDQGGIDQIDFLIAEIHETNGRAQEAERAKLMTRIGEDERLKSKINLDWI
jgi:hypothetical protein